MTETRDVVLASTSPRRRGLIGEMGIEVTFADPCVEEGPPLRGEAPDAYVLRLSTEKALGVSGQNVSAVVVAADTAVVLGGRVLGKPADESEAREMLRSLRGRRHTVVTGVTVLDAAAGRLYRAVEASSVAMRTYDDREIREYAASGEPMDKAGGYAVQDGRFRPADSVSGCYPNVVGLPLCGLVGLLARAGVDASLRPDSDAVGRCTDCPLRSPAEAGGA